MADVAFYERMAATTLRLIAAKGRDDLVLSRSTGTSYDPITDTEVAGAGQTQPLQCIVLPVDGTQADGLEAGTVIASNMREVKVAASGLTFVPLAGDSIQFESSRWVVMGVQPISPAGIPLLYTLAVKRG